MAHGGLVVGRASYGGVYYGGGARIGHRQDANVERGTRHRKRGCGASQPKPRTPLGRSGASYSGVTQMLVFSVRYPTQVRVRLDTSAVTSPLALTVKCSVSEKIRLSAEPRLTRLLATRRLNVCGNGPRA